MINFLAEISKEYKFKILTTPSAKYPKNYNIYEIDISEIPINTYWTGWGGNYDNYSNYNIVLYYEQFLSVKQTIGEVLNNPFSMIIIDRMVYFNIPKYPWFYPDYTVSNREVFPFLYSALNPDNPSNNIIENKYSPVKLEIPNVNIKLSDNYNGIILNQGFNLSLTNNDGYFDDEDTWKLFNSPISLKKSIKEISEYSDFREIRSGLVDNTITNFDNFQINISDKLRSMEEPVCDIVSNIIFPSITIEDSVKDKNIPIVYGTKTVKLLKLNSTQYLAAEKVTGVIAVYNKDGNTVPYTFNNTTGIITSSNEIDSAKITGWADNKIGEIVKDLITRKTGITYGLTNWNINEVDNYSNISPRINIEIDSGDVKKAVNIVLKSDMAYFIQQLDGKFTIRKYGAAYNIHNIPAYFITKKPEKDYNKAQENYFSSCRINYGFSDKETYKSLLFYERENEAEDKYNKKVLKTFDTDLYNLNEVQNFARLLSDRYTNLKQVIKLSLGIDTSSMNLLDTVIIDSGINDDTGIIINERKFSNITNYIIISINPSQDILELEEI